MKIVSNLLVLLNPLDYPSREGDGANREISRARDFETPLEQLSKLVIILGLTKEVSCGDCEAKGVLGVQC